MNERCSAVLLNKLTSKEKDPRSFTIPCDIGQLHIDNALADLGASISLMPYTMYKKLGLGEPKATRISLELADRGLEKSIDQSDLECCESAGGNENDGSDSENSIRRIDSANTPYPVTQGTTKRDDVKSEHLYSSSANEIDEKKPELKNLPQHCRLNTSWRQILSHYYLIRIVQKRENFTSTSIGETKRSNCLENVKHTRF
ncbi:reverse transcriptase domain-containing protein [Tanacetum coccineum]